MRCEEVRPLLEELAFDGKEVAAHLATCASCRDEAASLKELAGSVKRAFAGASSVEPPPFEAVLAAARARSVPRRGVLMVALLLIGIALGFALGRATAAPPPRVEERVREVLAARPTGLAAGLGVLRELSRR